MSTAVLRSAIGHTRVALWMNCGSPRMNMYVYSFETSPLTRLEHLQRFQLAVASHVAET